MEVGNLVEYRPFPPTPDDEFPFGIVIEELEDGYLILNISGKFGPPISKTNYSNFIHFIF